MLREGGTWVDAQAVLEHAIGWSMPREGSAGACKGGGGGGSAGACEWLGHAKGRQRWSVRVAEAH